MDRLVAIQSSAESEADHQSNMEVEANKQRRKIQNRKNQRAHRLRNKNQKPGSVPTTHSFQVDRWRVDEVDGNHTQGKESMTKDAKTTTSIAVPGRTMVLQRPFASTLAQPPTTPTPPSMVFPLSTDHLLHLIQYNVFRAFTNNKRTLNAVLKGWSYDMHSTTCSICPISFPYTDDTCIYPLNPNIPPSLFPTRLQQQRLHSSWINLFPFPALRDNLIRHEERLDHWELLQDLVGELMGNIPTEERRGTPLAITLANPKTMSRPPCAAEEGDEDEVTAGRRGLVVWGEPYDVRNWEATPGFLAKWSWAVQGCDDLLVSSNRWRAMRGEEPLSLPELENLSLR